MARLKLSCQPMLFGCLPAPTTCNRPPLVGFQPYVDTGRHQTVISNDVSEEESIGEGSEEEEAELFTILPAKKQGDKL